MFKLKTPCITCPFRTNIRPFISAERVAEIVQATAFQCHKTVNYGDKSKPRQGDHPQQCAGLMLMLHKSGHPNTIMQVGQRFKAFDPTKLDTSAPVYNDLWAAIEAHGGDPNELLPHHMHKKETAA